jgi:glycyl-tRNA synthetase beta chain
MSLSAALLVEIVTEELPPKALPRLGEAFANGIASALIERGFASADAKVSTFATPRRLAVLVDVVATRAADRIVRDKVLPVTVALDASGQPTAALIKKLAALGMPSVELRQLEREGEGKNEAFYLTRTIAGAALADEMDKVLAEVVGKLPIPKVMSYQVRPGAADELTVQFARPAHGLVVLHGSSVVDAGVLGLRSGRTTQGHRFMSPGAIEIAEAGTYARTLADQGQVVASFDERRTMIRAALAQGAAGDTLLAPDALIDEVTALVEWPVVYEGHFEKEYLEVPQQCLILTMQQNQRYFALTDTHGGMVNRFLLVSNLATLDASAIVTGNERVLRARLADAKFFYDQDRKRTLESRLPTLAAMVYHNKLGTQAARGARVAAIAIALARHLGADQTVVARAAHLAKADLVTDMVGEFPELQGIMGRYYAINDGEAAAVADAIEEHYRPRFSGDALPASTVGVCVALADKLEALCGLFGIGSTPTGDRDPYGLRRQALGVLRILAERRLPLEIGPLLGEGFATFSGVQGFTIATDELRAFLYERLRGQMKEQGFSSAQVESVISTAPERIDLVGERLRAVSAFSSLAEAQSLAAANKRIGNILKKSTPGDEPVDPALFEGEAERALFDALRALTPRALDQYQSGDYTAMLVSLAALRAPVDHFFDKVMVMAEDGKLRNNRLALLRDLHDLMNRVADLSKLAG